MVIAKVIVQTYTLGVKQLELSQREAFVLDTRMASMLITSQSEDATFLRNFFLAKKERFLGLLSPRRLSIGPLFLDAFHALVDDCVKRPGVKGQTFRKELPIEEPLNTDEHFVYGDGNNTYTVLEHVFFDPNRPTGSKLMYERYTGKSAAEETTKRPRDRRWKWEDDVRHHIIHQPGNGTEGSHAERFYSPHPNRVLHVNHVDRIVILGTQQNFGKDWVVIKPRS